MKDISSIIGVIVTVGGVLTVATVGALYVVGLWKQKKDGADDRLITLLKDTVGELEKKVDLQKREHDEEVGKLNRKIDDLTDKVKELEKENQTLVEVLQGRDKSTVEFQKQMLEAMRISIETNALAKETATKLQSLVCLMEDHIKRVEDQPIKK